MYSVLANPHPPRSTPRVVDRGCMNRRLEYSLTSYLNRFSSRSPSLDSSDDGSRPSLPESQPALLPPRIPQQPRKRRPPTTPSPPPAAPSFQNSSMRVPSFGFGARGEKKNDLKQFDLWSNRAEDEKILKLWKFQELTQAHLDMIRSISDNIDVYTSQMARSSERSPNEADTKPRKLPRNETQPKSRYFPTQPRGHALARKPQRRILERPVDPLHSHPTEAEETPEPILRVDNRDTEGRSSNMKATRSLPMPFGKTLPQHRIPADIEISMAKKEIQRLIDVAKKKLDKKRREREQRLNASMVTEEEDEGESEGKTTSPEMEESQSVFDSRPRGKMSSVLPALAKILRNSRRMAFVPVKQQSRTPVFRDTVVAIEMPDYDMSVLDVRPIQSTATPSPTPVAVETEDEQLSMERMSLRESTSAVSNATQPVVPQATAEGLHENLLPDFTSLPSFEEKSTPKEDSVAGEEQQEQSEPKSAEITATKSSGPSLMSRKTGASTVRIVTPKMESSSVPNTKIGERKGKVVSRRSSQKGVRRPQTSQRRGAHTPPPFAQRSRPQTASFPMDRSRRGSSRIRVTPRQQPVWVSPRRNRARAARSKGKVIAPISRATLDTDMSRSKATLNAESIRSKVTLATERRSRGNLGGRSSTGASLSGDKSRTGSHLGGDRSRTGSHLGGDRSRTGSHLGGDRYRTGSYLIGDKSRTAANLADKSRSRGNLFGEGSRYTSGMRGEVRSRMSGVSMTRPRSQPVPQSRPTTPMSHLSASKSRRLQAHAPSTITTTTSSIRPRTANSTRSQRYSGNSKVRPVQHRLSSTGGSNTKRIKGRVKS